MNADRAYCASSYLMFRYVFDAGKSFSGGGAPLSIVDLSFPRMPVRTARELLDALEANVRQACADGGAVLALSGGIDSAILAKLAPRGTKAYTFRCVVPGKQVLDESAQARHWAKLCGLEHRVVEIGWEDVLSAAPILMRHKGAPIHSIETQIYVAAKKAREEGARRFIFGENADIIYGGMNGLLAKDWLFAEFVERYAYVMPYAVLKEPRMILEPFREFERDGRIDAHAFINKYFRQEALGTYCNACATAGVEFVGPYSRTVLDAPIDYARIRGGDTKYVVREAFRLLYPNEALPAKTPMPRPMNEWMASWSGPTRPEFWPHCTDNMTGDQKWMVWCLERFFNLLEGRE